MKKISAYIQIYNDHELLEASLDSIKSYVDELVLVDGCYSWMMPYVEANGLNPIRSVNEVYSIVEKAGIPFKTITAVWKNQLEKRVAGFNDCSLDYVMRVDADEIILFDENLLSDFYMSDFAIACMQMPTFVTPNLYVGNKLSANNIPEQNFIFKKSSISAQEHLAYLWLILTSESAPPVEQLPAFPKPVAFNIHLTGWRTLDTSVGRASYYTLNWMRKYGAPWYPNLPDGTSLFPNLFNKITGSQFYSLMKRDRIALGKVSLEQSEIFLPSNLDPSRTEFLNKIYQNYLESFIAHNLNIKKQVFFSGTDLAFDISTTESFYALFPDHKLEAEVSTVIEDVEFSFEFLLNTDPYVRVERYPVYFQDKKFSANVDLPDFKNFVRIICIIRIYTKTPETIHFLDIL